MIHPKRERAHLDPAEIEPHAGIGVEAIELRHHAHAGGRSKRHMKRGSGEQSTGGGPTIEIEISSRREESTSPPRTQGHVVFERHSVEARKPGRGHDVRAQVAPELPPPGRIANHARVGIAEPVGLEPAASAVAERR